MRLSARLLIGLCLVFVARAADPGLIVASDLLQLKQLESPALSPDGRWVAYVVRSIESKPDNKEDWIYRSHLWLAATDGSTPPRQLTFAPANDTEPVWSPQGDRLAFVRAVEKEKPQLHLLLLSGGEPFALTKLETGATRPRWSPDGSRLLFSSSHSYPQVRAALEKAGSDAKPAWPLERPGRGANDTRNHLPKKKTAAGSPARPAPPDPALAPDPDGSLPARREWLAKNEADSEPRLLARLNFLDERDINGELSFAHLHVQEAVADAEPRDLTPGYIGFAGGEWMPDGRAIVCTGPSLFNEHPDRGEFTRLYRVPLDGGAPAVFAELPNHSLANPLPSPDGRHVALTAREGGTSSYAHQTTVALVPVTGGSPRLLTASLDRDASQLRWSRDSTALTFVAPANGAFPLYRVAIETGAVERLTPRADTGVRAYDLGPSSVALVLTTPANPSELHVGAPGATPAPLTRHNAAWLAAKRLSAYEEHRLVNAAGSQVQFWTMKPTAFDAEKKYPLLLQIHGGPSAMWGPGEESMWFEFQYFAARGYALVFVNPRGSGGYGRDFQGANFQDWGAGPAADILAAADFAARLPHVDARRQVLTGGSYGGYMVAWIVAHDHRFAAAVAQRGVYDLLTFFGEGNAWRLVRRAFGGHPWQPETRRILERESPLTYVESIRTPLLIQHGDNDRRTGFVQSEMLLRALKALGREVESVRYPRASHEMSRTGEPRQRLDSLVRYEEFFRRYIGEN